MGLLASVISGFALAILAPWVHRAAREATGLLLALLPLGLTAYFLGCAPGVAAGEPVRAAYTWVPTLGVAFSLRLDGLSLLFALLICGVGALILIYAGGYLAGHERLGRFYAYLLLFMASMLGVALADNVVTLFVFWELTSFSSYLLIGFDRERAAARAAALQALVVTAMGGVALLAGLLLLGQAGGSLELSELLARGSELAAHPLAVMALLLIFFGAFTKSAQVPFHFWLPNAMEAPTPVSAYLHAATMVKAGIYLLARLTPIFGESETWFLVVTAVGAVTMLTGAWLALRADDLKRILAYSTVSSLGTMTLLLGLGTPAAAQAVVVYLFAHALYKGALFLVAGIIDHETGARRVPDLGGLRRAMPLTAAAAGVAALSMAGVPPLAGFLSKELHYAAAWESPQAATVLAGASVLAGMLLFAAAGLAAYRPFFGEPRPTPRQPHDPPASLWLGPALLAGLGALFGLLPWLVDAAVLAPAVAAIRAEPATLHLALWHAWNPVLGLSLITLAGGLGFLATRNALQRWTSGLGTLESLAAQRWFERALKLVNGLARWQTRFLQSGYLRYYLITVISATVGLSGYAVWTRVPFSPPGSWLDALAYELAVAALILAAAWTVVRSTSRLGAIAALGVVGYGVAILYILFGAPDLAMTQFLVETLTVILFVLVFYHLPRFSVLTRTPARVRDAVVALALGGFVATLVLLATSAPGESTLTPYFLEQSLPAAHGRNVVNVILVDFRALDTLGEITVLSVAGIGVYALLKLRLAGGKSR